MSKITILLACVLSVSLSAPALAQGSGDASETYLSIQVDKEVKLRSGSQPRYPSRLVATRQAGEVLVQFVVNERGQPQMESFKVLKSSNAEFTESVRRAVTNMNFFPAEIAGKKVKQLVQVPFKFAAGS